MAKFVLHVNGKKAEIDADPETPLLWVLRETLGLTGTKYGCGEGLCGSCTVLIDGEAMRSCTLAVGDAAGKKIITIEGLAVKKEHPVLKAWLEDEVSQCGYCQPGQIVAAVALLNKKPNPDDKDIDEAMTGILCRCGTYPRIRRAIHRAAEMKGGGK
jgi:isoquinoline 1-oxidoreductase subunit alpha